VIHGSIRIEDIVTLLNRSENGNLDSISVRELAEALNGEQKRIQVPSFQRDAVWDEDHVQLLWDSILRGFPIGSLLFSRVADIDVAKIGLREAQVSRAEPASRITTQNDQTEFIVIDGQQRSISIALGLRKWRSKDSARLWLDLGKAQRADEAFYRFYVCSLLKPWGLAATAAMQREALNAIDPAAMDERKRLRLDNDDVLLHTWPVRATLPVPFAELLDWLINGRSGDWMHLVPQAKHSGQPRQDLDELFERAERVGKHEIPIFLAKGLSPDDLGQVFHRLNRQGYDMSGEELFFSALKMRWPQAHDLVWEVYGDQQTGKFLQPTQIVHLAVRMVAAADERDIVRLSNREFERLVERAESQDRSYLERVQNLLQERHSGSDVGRLHHCLCQARSALAYDPGRGKDDIGLPVTLLARLRWRVWHALVAWIYTHNTIDPISRVEMIRYALLDHFYTKSSSSVLVREPFQQAFAAGGSFPGFTIYATLQEKELVEPDILTPEKYRELLCGDPDALPRRGILQRERELAMWIQRDYFHRWFDRFDPTLYRKEVDLPYDADHIIPQAHLNMRGRRYRLPPEFWSYRGPVLHSAGNFRYWPKALNRADGQRNLDEKYLLGAPEEETPPDSYLRDIDLDTVGDVRLASFIGEDQLGYWERASNNGGYAYDWTDPERIRAFRKATELRRIAMYTCFYEQVGWGDWSDKMKLADQIRQYVIEELIDPARQAGKGELTVRSGDVHKAMGLDNRMPAVCGALDAVKFYDEAGVRLVTRSGPYQSSTVEWVLGL
jgi:hypothetical protein